VLKISDPLYNHELTHYSRDWIYPYHVPLVCPGSSRPANASRRLLFKDLVP
jgi:hypothetical protein